MREFDDFRQAGSAAGVHIGGNIVPSWAGAGLPAESMRMIRPKELPIEIAFREGGCSQGPPPTRRAGPAAADPRST